ncbi:ArsR/SmtB family transcription factor [Brachybacterium massiliense]|uniref:ArsR/SmtB family transcription factor n=1 Tax=Brachybacterium massiliense TaxID=1755098 RepID=UPI000B3BCFE3|nr:metalloregulator ArsR/SmtB family transcription factor [Brachybacterium massiliense]
MTIDAIPAELQFEVADSHAALFHALAEPTRLALLQHLSTGEHRVRDLVEHMHLAQSTVSKHLSCLRDCGLVTARTEGRASWFALTDLPRLSDLLEAADDLLDTSGTTLSLKNHRDHENLEDGGL